DLDRGTMMIRRTLERIVDRTVPVFNEPKSATSRRLITLGPAAIDALRAQRTRQKEDQLAVGPSNYGGDDLVFANRVGGPLIRRNVLRDYKLLLERAGLATSFRVHDLRHLSATIMLVAGVHPTVASGRLGHS